VPAERVSPARPAAAPIHPDTPPAAVPAAPATDLKALTARLSLQVLGWAPEPRDRFVFINGRKYREGQAIDDKLLIERIADDSVVLSYQGERVTLKGP
jgi:general secretion pathway protein B